MVWIGVGLRWVLITGCLVDFDPPGPDDPGPAFVSIATGAEVALRLEHGGLCFDTVGVQCLSERPDTILDVVIGDEDVVALGPRTFDSTRDALTVELEGLKPDRTAMEVTYVDRRGQVVDRYELRVADVARVDLDVLCPVWGHDGTVFPVTVGADVRFRHEAFDANGNALATGRMEVVTSFGGFTAPAPPRGDGEIRTATAPDQVGSHDWSLWARAAPRRASPCSCRAPSTSRCPRRRRSARRPFVWAGSSKGLSCASTKARCERTSTWSPARAGRWSGAWRSSIACLSTCRRRTSKCACRGSARARSGPRQREDRPRRW